jgi:hypothetical protein
VTENPGLSADGLPVFVSLSLRIFRAQVKNIGA